MIKEKSNEFEKRILRTIACPQNKYIPRVENAGEIIGDYQIMHNGLKVQVDGYYGEYKSNGRGFITDMLLRNHGVHEPQEECMFMDVLNDIPAGGVMLELGSYWAFYSMWFYQKIKDAKCYMIEPDGKNIQIGMNNFVINGFEGNFSIGSIPNFKVDKWMEDNSITYLDILHADTQGYELNVLQDAEQSLLDNKIKYVFVSGHSQELHNDCIAFLKKCNYEIIGEADFDNESNCLDSVIVARNKSMEGVKYINLNEELPIQMTPVNQGAINYVGTRPVSGILQLDVLLQEGMKPHHSLFELGCGALVGSIPMIRYLNKDRYYGVDPNEWLRNDTLAIEGNRDILEKNPIFYSNEDFKPENEIKFDYIFAHSILNHAANWQFELFLDNIKKHMKKDTIIIASLHFAEGSEYGKGYGHWPEDKGPLNSDKWTYPGVNFKPKAYVFECCKIRNLKCEHIEEYTKSYTRLRPNEFHNWIRITKE